MSIMITGVLLIPALLAGHVAQSATPVVRTDYDLAELTTPPALSADELTGRRLFVQRCYLCHDPVGQPRGRAPGPWLDHARVTARGDSGMRDYILQGSDRMPGFQYQLEGAQVDQIIAFLKTVTLDDRPDTAEREVFSPESSGGANRREGRR